MNKYQTVFTEEDFKSVPKEVRNEFYDVLSSIKFVNWLVQPEEIRGFARDLKRWDNPNDLEYRKEDPNGRIYVDLTKPHILIDMDFFRERAIFYDKYGKYTDIPPNPNPKSAYAAFWREELRRWKYGLIRPSDGEWIPGGLYFYWNYSPIWLTKNDDKVKRKGKSRGTRVRAFPHPWLGDYLFYHYKEQAREKGEHVKVLKTRGVGVSFKMGAESPRNMYVYPGSGNPNFHLASDKTFLTGDKGVFGKVIDTLDWIAEHTPLPKLRLLDSKQKMEIQLGYLDEYGVRKGLLSSVYGISMKDNPDKARGIRGPLIHYEEDGLFPHLEDAWNINRKAVEDGDTTNGQMLALGTGGVLGADFAGAEKLFYNPTVYNIYGIPNVFDRNANGESLCGFFWGAYLNRNGCYDKTTGEPDVTKALYEILLDRYTVKKGAADARAITQKKAEEPLTPQDSIMRVEGSIFPVADLKDHLADILPNLQRFVAPHYVGNLVLDSMGEVKFEISEEAYPIRDYPAIDNRLGAVEIFEMPPSIKEPFRFIIGVDSYDDDDVSYSDSLGSVFVFDRWTRRIVAEYTGRPQTANAFYEVVYRLAIFYNATIMYENNKKGLYAYFNNVKKALHLLADTPELITDKQIFRSKSTLSNTSKGINATAAINAYGRRLQADWQVEEAYDERGNDTLEDGEEKVFIPNLRKIRSIGYIKECIAWNMDINTDRCLLKDTLIETSSGTKKIQDISLDDYVLTFSGKYHKVINLYRHYNNGNKVRIKVLGDYRLLECTGNHPIYIKKSKKKKAGINWMRYKHDLTSGEFMEAEELSKGDYVLLPKRKGLPESSISPDLLYFLGWYLADGWVSEKTSLVRIFLQYDQYEIGKDLLKILNYRFHNKYTDVEGRTEKNGRIVNPFKVKRRRSEAVLYRSKNSNMWVLEKSDPELKKFILDNCNRTSDKRLNPQIYNTSNLLPLLKGFFEGDGHYRCGIRSDNIKRSSLEVNNTNEKLILQVRQILLDNSIWNTIRYVSNKNKKNSKPQYNISVTGENVARIIEGSKKFIQKIHSTNKIKHQIEVKEGFLVPIKNVECFKEDTEVFNIGVDTDETYVASGILTHNCSAMNMVMIYDVELAENGTQAVKTRLKTLADDPFFNRFGKNVEQSSFKLKGWSI